MELPPCGSLTGTLTLSSAYELGIRPESNKIYVSSEDARNSVDVASTPGVFLMNALPARTSFSQSLFAFIETNFRQRFL